MSTTPRTDVAEQQQHRTPLSATAPLIDLIVRLEAWADENTPKELLDEARAAIDAARKL